MKASILVVVMCFVLACSAATEDGAPASTDLTSAAPTPDPIIAGDLPAPEQDAATEPGSVASPDSVPSNPGDLPTPEHDGNTDPAPVASPDSVPASPRDEGAKEPALPAVTPSPVAMPVPPTPGTEPDTKDAGDSDRSSGGPLPTATRTPIPDTPEPLPSTPVTSTMFGPVECEGSGRIQFTHFPLEPGIISSIRPMGAMSGSHVTPTDHIYITHDRADEPGHGYVVRMPGDGIVVEVGRMPNPNRPDYRIVIAHTCTLFTTFIHTGEPVSELKTLIGELELGANWYGAFPIKAGDVLANASTNTMDFMVHDADVTLPGFVLPETYAGEPWKIHTLDPFDFYDEPLRSQVLAFNPRTAEPRGGKIDYDIDGRLVGNWFVQGSGGYSGSGPGGGSYWETHLAIAYDYIDPSVLLHAIGADTGIPEDACGVCSGVYGIKGNAPDPAIIGVQDGLVKYELIGRIRPEKGAPAFNDESNSIGVLLAEMVDDRRVRIEVIPGVSPSAVTGFTGAAVMYSR